MDTENGTKASLTVRAEIDWRLAALTQEQLIAPQKTRDPDAHFACTANDEVKRLFTLRNQLRDECKKASLDAIRLGEAAQRRLQSREGLLEIVKEMRTPGSPALEALATMRRTQCELQQLLGILTIVTDILRYETLRQHSDLADKSGVFIYSDWSLCWKEDPDDDRGIITEVLIRNVQAGSDDDEIPPPNRLH